MKYAYIDKQSAYHSITMLCSALQVSRSGYYNWRNHHETPHEESDRLLKDWITEIFEDSRSRYGVRRIRSVLNDHGVRISRRRVARLKRELGLVCKAQKRFKSTTDSNHKLPVAPNRLNRVFEIEAPDDVYVGDITYIPTQEGWLYLAVWIDLCTRMVVGWSMTDHMKASLVGDALRMACFKRRPEKGLLIHSDRGVQYASEEFRNLLNEKGFLQSMSRKGNCWDNAPSESFFHTLKTEWVDDHSYATREKAKQSIFEYIEVFYNRQRKHSTIGYITPAQADEKVRMVA